MRTQSPRNHPIAAALALLVTSALALAFSGCLNLKPVADTTRYFVLMPPSGTPLASSPGPAVGIGPVEIPDYLQPKRIALRKSGNEIHYADKLQWAERLDKGIQRVLGASLSSQLEATNVLLSFWRRNDVQAEVYVSVLRFDTDERGQVVLEARWRVTNPGAESTLRAGTSRLTQLGPAFSQDPDGATATLGQAVAELSREIALAVRTLVPTPTSSASPL